MGDGERQREEAEPGEAAGDTLPLAPATPDDSAVVSRGAGPGATEGPVLPPTSSKEPVRASVADDMSSADTVYHPGAVGERTSQVPGLLASSQQRYGVRDILGEGGIGRVFRVRDGQLERDVALKELRPEVAGEVPTSPTGTAVRDRFIKEARITGLLEHPGIVPVYDLGVRDDGSIYYTMRVVRGRTLGAALGAKLEERLELLPHFVDLCQAVAFAHEQGVIHRDLKPDNVMLGDFGETVVLDWGLAKARGERDVQAGALADNIDRLRNADVNQTVAGVPLGTPAYMPPEQARGELDQIDERSDVYSLGAILYQLLTGRPPFLGASALEVVQRSVSEPPPPPERLAPGCPPALVSVALRALEKDPERRYPDAKALAADVKTFLTGGLVGAHQYTVGQLAWQWIRRHRVLVAVVSVGILAAVGAWWYGGYTQQQEARQAEAQRRRDAVSSVTAILDQARKAPSSERWLEALTFRLISLNEPIVQGELIRHLSDRSADVRKLVARALGGMRSERATAPLAARLERGAETDPQVMIEVINALGMLGDPSTDRAVLEARIRAGVSSVVWKRTEIAYRMIPVRALTPAQEAAMSPHDWFWRGRSIFQKHEDKAGLERARGALDRALAKDPKLVAALSARAIVRRDLGDLDGARKDFDAALALKPGNPALLNNRALFLLATEDFEEALQDLDRVVASGALGATAYRNRSRLRMKLHRFDAAVADIAHALELSPNHPSNYAQLGHIWFERNRWGNAMRAYSRALELNDDYVFVLLRRATVHEIQGDRVAAQADIERAIEQQPGHRGAFRRRAILRNLEGDRAGALADLDRAIAFRPRSAPGYVARAIVHHAELGHWREAIHDVQAAVAREGDPIVRREITFLGLVLTHEAGDDDLVRRAARSLPRRPDGTFMARVEETLRDPSTVTTTVEHTRTGSDACIAYLAAALGESLRGRPERAARYLLAGAKIKRPFDLPCRLARRLSAQRPVAPTATPIPSAPDEPSEEPPAPRPPSPEPSSSSSPGP